MMAEGGGEGNPLVLVLMLLGLMVLLMQLGRVSHDAGRLTGCRCLI